MGNISDFNGDVLGNHGKSWELMGNHGNRIQFQWNLMCLVGNKSKTMGYDILSQKIIENPRWLIDNHWDNSGLLVSQFYGG